MKYLTTIESESQRWHFWREGGYPVMKHDSMDWKHLSVRTPMFYDEDTQSPGYATLKDNLGFLPLSQEIVEAPVPLSCLCEHQPGLIETRQGAGPIDALIIYDGYTGRFSVSRGDMQMYNSDVLQASSFVTRTINPGKMDLLTAFGTLHVYTDRTGTVFRICLPNSTYDVVLYSKAWYDPTTTLFNVAARLVSVGLDLVEFQEILLREYLLLI